MAFDLKTATPDASIPDAGFLFGADSQSAADPSVYAVSTLLNKFLGSGGFSGGTVTADTPLLNQAQTWNNSGVTFTGWKLNVTDTASASGSLLMDLQVGGTSKFSVAKDAGFYLDGNLIEQRNSTNAQSFNLYNTYTDASNYERGFMRWDGNELKIGAVSAGTGGSRSVGIYSNNVRYQIIGSNFNQFDKNLYMNGANIVTGGAGFKIGTAANQPIGFWNATPVVQPTTGISAGSFVANTSGIINDTATFDGYTIGQVVAALRQIGLLA